jgi:hypothetical protein
MILKFRELNAGKDIDTESKEDDFSESDYLDKDNGDDTPSGLLSSDLAFYMPPDSGSSSSSSVDSMRKNKKSKSIVSSSPTKHAKGLSSEYKLVSFIIMIVVYLLLLQIHRSVTSILCAKKRY